MPQPQSPETMQIRSDLSELRTIIDQHVTPAGPLQSDGYKYENGRLTLQKIDDGAVFLVHLSDDDTYSYGNGQESIGSTAMYLRFSGKLAVLGAGIELSTAPGRYKKLTNPAVARFVGSMLTGVQQLIAEDS